MKTKLMLLLAVLSLTVLSLGADLTAHGDYPCQRTKHGFEFQYQVI
jgi:hypothetical protein